MFEQVVMVMGKKSNAKSQSITVREAIVVVVAAAMTFASDHRGIKSMITHDVPTAPVVQIIALGLLRIVATAQPPAEIKIGIETGGTEETAEIVGIVGTALEAEV
jgi:hypothetical protein